MLCNISLSAIGRAEEDYGVTVPTEQEKICHRRNRVEDIWYVDVIGGFYVRDASSVEGYFLLWSFARAWRTLLKPVFHWANLFARTE